MSTVAWVAGFDEAEAVGGLLIQFRDHLGRDRPSDNAILAGVERLIEDPATEFLLAAPSADEPPAGVAQLRFRWGIWYAAADCHLEDLFVAEHARRRGVAGTLLEAIFERARARECRRVELDAAEDNVAGRALYKRYGFREETLFLRRYLDED